MARRLHISSAASSPIPSAFPIIFPVSVISGAVPVAVSVVAVSPIFDGLSVVLPVSGAVSDGHSDGLSVVFLVAGKVSGPVSDVRLRAIPIPFALLFRLVLAIPPLLL